MARTPNINTIATGQRIRELMDENGYTTKDLQEIFGFNYRTAFYKWFDGRSLPTVDNLVVLARLFGCGVDDILVLC